ncbi:hypothetical protein APA73_15670 [Pseudomonas aeruginosa]|uniref:AraC-like ligand-binding domain-containing protein n=1 Tax=Pseudomonas aeruginosa TaxID=287 RepID=UPI00071C17FB|nr:hypothetical protein [Pseudomonas aeruginosa]KSL69714.1 hypothetical protein APA58_15300 [Pseudomonas aeruginosa]KSM82955.1 hypothetical protein APA73_15670 [Pseudomonas aeruginosa]MDI2561136.1 hypothetical protein [Pseudomonas aeruginosa]HBN9636404.1 hypothetical protein [Pseudomonas aeruginosa]HCL3672452.1 hypothetical protein [Pseudomonas aeruginosa]
MGVSSLQPLVMPAYPLPPAWMGASDLPPDTLLFESLDLEYAQEQIGRVYRPYHFNADYRKRIGPASMFRLLGEGIQVSWFSFGTEISVEPEISDDFILVLTTLDGHADICSGRLRHRSNFGSTVVIAADALSRCRAIASARTTRRWACASMYGASKRFGNAFPGRPELAPCPVSCRPGNKSAGWLRWECSNSC